MRPEPILLQKKPSPEERLAAFAAVVADGIDHLAATGQLDALLAEIPPVRAREDACSPTEERP